MRKFDDAAAELDKVAAVDKDYPGLSLERGLLFEESGDVEKAIEQFKSALAKAPDDPDLQLRVGSAYVAIGRPDEALPMLRKVLEKRPTSAEAHHYIGRALMLQGPSEQADALRYLKRAVDLDPNRAEFHVYLAWAANDAKPAQLELARDEIDKALALDKLNAEAYWQRGVLERMEGADRRRASRTSITRSRCGPSRYEAHATLAECYEDKNDDATALAEWARAIAGDGTRPTPTAPFRIRSGATATASCCSTTATRRGARAAAARGAGGREDRASGPAGSRPARVPDGRGAAQEPGETRSAAASTIDRFLEHRPVNSPDRADATGGAGQLGAAVGTLSGRPEHPPSAVGHPREGLDLECLAAGVEGDARLARPRSRGRRGSRRKPRPRVAQRLAPRLEGAPDERAETLGLERARRSKRAKLDDGARDVGRRVERARRRAQDAAHVERRAARRP